MKQLSKYLLAVLLLGVSASAQTSVTPQKNSTPPAKLGPKDIRVFPFCEEHKEVKYKSTSNEIPNELIVTTGDHVHVYGKKHSDVVNSRGTPVGHVGKVILFPPNDRIGTLVLKKTFGTTFFFTCLELPGDALDSKRITLAEGKPYSWTIKTENGQTALRVAGPDGVEVGSCSGPTDKVLGAGFAGTVRNKGNEIDMTITFE